eukprot:SRR837773.6546.p1 GENE.SRR837773.6546~~SRR837773.6546.p1  ORF type:complete len:414 (+),score=130.11 SRR837773.6546:183-1244(+)
MVRWLAGGNTCWHEPWFIFDAVLVGLGLLSNCILIPFVMNSKHVGARLMEQILIVRVLRLLRLVRALRMLEQFRSLWRLVQGLLMSARTMLSTVLLLVFTVYVFACVGVELITKDKSLVENDETGPIIATNFGSIPRLMLTLVQFATMDSIAAIYSPLIYRNPWLIVYFVPILLLVSVTVMNLITAVLVEDAISSARMDAEMEQAYLRKRLKSLIPEIRQVFVQLDVSQDGFVGLGELAERMAELQDRKIAIPKEVAKILDPEKVTDLEAIFDYLDFDGSRTIDEDEFVEGVCQLAFTHVPLETTQMLQMLKQQRIRFEMLSAQVQDLALSLSSTMSACRTTTALPQLSHGYV